MQNPYAAYIETEATTTPPERIVMTLYEEGVRLFDKAIEAVKQSDMDSFKQQTDFAYRIVSELQRNLNPGAGEIALRLDQLYTYTKHEISLARKEKSAEHLANGKQILEELASGWHKMLERLN